jgi:hypothetical protein
MNCGFSTHVEAIALSRFWPNKLASDTLPPLPKTSLRGCLKTQECQCGESSLMTADHEDPRTPVDGFQTS